MLFFFLQRYRKKDGQKNLTNLPQIIQKHVFSQDFHLFLLLYLCSGRCSLSRMLSWCGTAESCMPTVLLLPLSHLQPQSSTTGQEFTARLHQLNTIKSNLPCQERVNELQKHIPKFSEPLGCCLQSPQGTSLIQF